MNWEGKIETSSSYQFWPANRRRSSRERLRQQLPASSISKLVEKVSSFTTYSPLACVMLQSIFLLFISHFNNSAGNHSSHAHTVVCTRFTSLLPQDIWPDITDVTEQQTIGMLTSETSLIFLLLADGAIHYALAKCCATLRPRLLYVAVPSVCILFPVAQTAKCKLSVQTAF